MPMPVADVPAGAVGNILESSCWVMTPRERGGRAGDVFPSSPLRPFFSGAPTGAHPRAAPLSAKIRSMNRARPPLAGQSAKQARMLEVLELFRIVFKSVRRHYQSVEQRAGIRGAQLWALAQIAEQPGIRVGDLARALAIHQSTASNLLRDLEASALITRKRLRHDQRTVRLYPTARAAGILRRAPRPLIGVLQQALADLPAEHLDALQLQLLRLISTMPAQAAEARRIPLSEI